MERISSAMWQRLESELRLRKDFIFSLRMKHQLGLFSPCFTYGNAKITEMDDVGFRVQYGGIIEFVTWTDYESFTSSER